MGFGNIFRSSLGEEVISGGRDEAISMRKSKKSELGEVKLKPTTSFDE